MEEWIKDILDQRLELLLQHHRELGEIRAPVSGGLGVSGLPDQSDISSDVFISSV